MNIVVTNGNKNLEISFRQKLSLAEGYSHDGTRKVYEVTAFAKGFIPKCWILACPSKDGNPIERLNDGEEINLFRLDRKGRINSDEKIRVKLA